MECRGYCGDDGSGFSQTRGLKDCVDPRRNRSSAQPFGVGLFRLCLSGQAGYDYAMQSGSKSTPLAKSRQGQALLKEAIIELLESDGTWLKRKLIEEKLDLASVYKTDAGASYPGALASMLLNELATKKKIQQDWDGSARIYAAKRVAK